MQVVQKSQPESGLRERKRAKTYARIQDEALRLFLNRGFENTTLDDIAEAADISRRSLFAYFESKEEIVLCIRADYPTVIAEAVARRPANESLLEMVENALVNIAAHVGSPETKYLSRLIHDTPALRAGEQAKYERVESALVKALTERKGLPESDAACRVTAAMAIGIMKVAIAEWLDDADSTPQSHFKKAFATLRDVTVSCRS